MANGFDSRRNQSKIIIIIHIILDIEDLTHRGNIIIGETEITTIQIIEIIVTATMTLITKIIHTITITIEEIIIMAIIQILTMDEMVVEIIIILIVQIILLLEVVKD